MSSFDKPLLISSANFDRIVCCFIFFLLVIYLRALPNTVLHSGEPSTGVKSKA